MNQSVPMTLDEIQAQLPPKCHLAVLQGRVVIVWSGEGPIPREVLRKFGTKQEREDHR